LAAYAQVRITVVGIESLIVAIGAAAPTLRTIAIGASKSCMDGNLLHLTLEILRKEGSKVII
jgi:hypothetical protein